jgi:hypothetical protein
MRSDLSRGRSSIFSICVFFFAGINLVGFFSLFFFLAALYSASSYKSMIVLIDFVLQTVKNERMPRARQVSRMETNNGIVGSESFRSPTDPSPRDRHPGDARRRGEGTGTMNVSLGDARALKTRQRRVFARRVFPPHSQATTRSKTFQARTPARDYRELLTLIREPNCRGG